jgi:hypothetical protein
MSVSPTAAPERATTATSPLQDVQAPRRAAADVLASLLDLRGSVDLARAIPPLRERHRSSAQRATRGMQEVRARLTTILDDVERRLVSKTHGRPRLPDAAGVFRTLEKAGLLATPRSPSVFARGLASTFRERFVDDLRHVLEAMSALREEVLRASPQAGDLAGMDQALARATDGGITRLIDRFAEDMENGLTRDIEGAVHGLPEDGTLDDVEPWFTEGGVLGAARGRMANVVRGLLSAEREVVLALAADAEDGTGEVGT